MLIIPITPTYYGIALDSNRITIQDMYRIEFLGIGLGVGNILLFSNMDNPNPTKGKETV